MRYLICLVALCLPLMPACSPNKVAVAVTDKDKQKDKDKAPAAKTLNDSWQAAYLEGLKIGHGHTLSVLTKNKDGKEVIRTTRYLDFVLKRYRSALPVRQEQICEETPEGKVLYLEETLTIGKNKTGPLKGTVSGNQLILVVGNDTNARKLDFPADAVGLYFQETYFSRKKPKTGDKFKITSFELSLLAPGHADGGREGRRDDRRTRAEAGRRRKEGRPRAGQADARRGDVGEDQGQQRRGAAAAEGHVAGRQDDAGPRELRDAGRRHGHDVRHDEGKRP